MIKCRILKNTLTITFFLFSFILFAQTCNCKEKPELKEIISCEKTTFKNGAKIYWGYNCDSSWLTYENKKTKKKIFTLEKELQEMVGRLGFISWVETKDKFIIKNKTASGCCYPLEISLFNKNNGRKEKDLGILISDDRENRFIVTLLDFNTVQIYEVKSDKSTKINLAKGSIQNTLKKSGDFYPDKYFSDLKFENRVFSMNYQYLDQNDAWIKRKLKVELKP